MKTRALIILYAILLVALSCMVLSVGFLDGRSSVILSWIALALVFSCPIIFSVMRPTPTKTAMTLCGVLTVAIVLLYGFRIDMDHRLPELDNLISPSDKVLLYSKYLFHQSDSQVYNLTGTQITIRFPIVHQYLSDANVAEYYLGFSADMIYWIRLAQYDKPIDPNDILDSVKKSGSQSGADGINFIDYRGYKAVDVSSNTNQVPTISRTIIVGDQLLTVTVTALREGVEPKNNIFETVEFNQTNQIDELDLHKECYSRDICDKLRESVI